MWVLLALLTLPFASSAVVKIAVAKVLAADEAASGPITGTVTFTTIDATSTRVEVDVTGLAPHSTHGFHAHQYGDLRELTTFGTVGLHFMPLCSNRRRLQTPTASPTAAPFQAPSNPGGNTCLKDQVHGYPPSEYRQPGDMGNITADAAGNVQTTLIIGQSKMDLSSDLRSIVGRAIVIHTLADDGNPKTTGNAGGPLAMGVIGIAAVGTADTNDAAAPNIPAPDKVTCVFDAASKAANNGIFGKVVLSKHIFNPTATLHAEVYGLAAGTLHSWHFHRNGDLSGSGTGFTNLGAIYEGPDGAQIKLETFAGAGLTSPSYFAGTYTMTEFRSHVGTSLTIHSGPTSSSPTIAASVCGLSHPDAAVVVPGSGAMANSATRGGAELGGAVLLALAAALGSFTL